MGSWISFVLFFPFHFHFEDLGFRGSSLVMGNIMYCIVVDIDSLLDSRFFSNVYFLI